MDFNPKLKGGEKSMKFKGLKEGGDRLAVKRVRNYDYKAIDKINTTIHHLEPELEHQNKS